MKLFEKFRKKKKEGEEVKVDEVVKMVVENSSLKATYGRIMNLFLEIENIKKGVSEKLKVLGETPITVREGEERLKLLVEGNRDNYIKVMESFISKIDTPREMEGALNFCEGLETELDGLSKKTTRNFYVMQNLIGNELVSVTKDVKRIDGLVKEVKRLLEDEKLQKVEAINEKINLLKSGKEVESNLEELETEKKELENKKESMSWNLEELKETDDYKILTSLRSKRKKTKKEGLEIESEIRNLFSSLERPLKKFERMYEGDVLGVYIKDFVQGLVSDKELKILDVLKELENKIGRLALKDPDKVLRSIAEIRKEKLVALRKGYLDLKMRKKELEEKLMDNNVEDRIREKESGLVLIEKDLSEVKKKITGLKIVDKEKIILELEKDILELTSIEVIIKDAMG